MKLLESLLKSTKHVSNFTKDNSSAILIGVGLVGMGASMVMVNNAAPKAHDILEKRHEEKKPETTKEKLEDVKAVAPLYLPAVLTFTVSSACILRSYKISTRKIASLATAYTITENKLEEYKNKVIEKIGEEKEKEIEDEIVKDHIKDNENDIQQGDTPDSMGPMLDGKQWFWDDFSKRFFRASLKEVFQAKEDINVRLQLYPVKLNEFYCELGLEEVESLDIYEWAEGDSLEISFEPYTCRDGVTIVTALHYDVPVSRDYSYRY